VTDEIDPEDIAQLAVTGAAHKVLGAAAGAGDLLVGARPG